MKRLAICRRLADDRWSRPIGCRRGGQDQDSVQSTKVSIELRNVQRLAAALRENLAQCGHDPGVDPVHDTRTGTRRLQATLENLAREMPEDDAGQAVRAAAARLTRQLKKIRRAAAPVRDLDVHRRLLEKLTREALGLKSGVEAQQEGDQPEDVLESRAAGFRTTGLGQQADHLDAWLKHERAEKADGLQAQAAGLAAKLDKRLAELEAAMRQHPRSRRAQAPAALALENFARLATEMQLLDAKNLHDFRKGAKKARYIAELAEQADAYAGQVGKALRKLQDEIGDWHDWLVLAEEAHAALGDEAAELMGLVEAEREQHFVAALKTAAKLRGRLMGEWLATGRRGQARGSQRKSAQVRTDQRESDQVRTVQRCDD